MIQVRDIRLQRGDQILFNQASLTVFAGQKIGLIGANGTGKSSLFALIKKELEPELVRYSYNPISRLRMLSKKYLIVICPP